jgi:hypothetical protein
MHDHSIDHVDEMRHQPGSGRFWSESYYFDFFDEEGSVGGYVRIGLYPNLGVTWYWACLVGAGRPLVTVIEHQARVPEAPSLSLQHAELVANHDCRSPTERFALELEAKALVLPDPAATYGPLEGEKTPFSLDLEWQTDGPGGYRFRDLERYELPCQVRGQIRVGDERIDFGGYGQRDHSWGERDWWANAWCWNAGRLEDGTRFHSVAPRTLDGQNLPWAAGYIQPPGSPLEPIHHSFATEEVDASGFPVTGRIEVGDLHLDLRPLHFSPVLLVDPDGRVSRFPRALCRFIAIDGREGLGWIEWNQPQQG